MKSQEWTAAPGKELEIPAEYLTGLVYEILILSAKKTFTFRCTDYKLDGQICTFNDVIMDTSLRNARGNVTLRRVSYHENIILANVGFMAIPIPPEASETRDDSEPAP